jgi:23S rRNA pseudouridine2605 synthase
MCEAVGHPVRRLHRSRYAGLALEGLEPGAWRELEPSEVEAVRTRTAPPPGQGGFAPP